MFVDSHAHLDGERFSSDLPEVLLRAEAAGVDRIVCIACAVPEPESLDGVLQLVEQHPQLFAALGIHPHDAGKATSDLPARIAELMSHPKVLAWGEIGLDFYYDYGPRDRQRQIFELQLAAAREAGKPVIIHSRNAAEETIQALEQEFRKGPLSGVMHCFTYGREMARKCIDLGFYLGFGGILTFPRSEELRQIAVESPLDRCLLETDSPFLAPVPHRGKRNEPSFVVRVAETLAELRATSLEDIGRRTTENFERLFRPAGEPG